MTDKTEKPAFPIPAPPTENMAVAEVCDAIANYSKHLRDCAKSRFLHAPAGTKDHFIATTKRILELIEAIPAEQFGKVSFRSTILEVSDLFGEPEPEEPAPLN